MDDEDICGKGGCDQIYGNQEYHGGADRNAARSKTIRTATRTVAARSTIRSTVVRAAVARQI